jgi:hypothetical protein
MKKEVVIAVVLGVVVGLIITFGIYTANAALQRRARQLTATPSPTPLTNEQKSSIILFSPEDNTLTDKDALSVSGTTTANSLVVIFVNEQEHVTTADEKGNFSEEVELVGGSNILTIVATDPNGKQEQVQRTVVYSTANLDDAAVTATPAASPAPSPSVKPKATPAGAL